MVRVFRRVAFRLRRRGLISKAPVVGIAMFSSVERKGSGKEVGVLVCAKDRGLLTRDPFHHHPRALVGAR